MPAEVDRGNLHIIDYYLHLAITEHRAGYLASRPRYKSSESDFDIDTERREGWTYQ